MRQCWAFSKDGVRCEQEAGHDGNHSVTHEWDDLQCATPGEFDITTPEPVYPAPPVKVGGVTKCVVCSHVMHDGECISCECRTGVAE